MKKILKRLLEFETLTRSEAREIMLNTAEGLYNDTELTAFITVYLMRSITIDELLGFKDALLEKCLPVTLNYEVMDIVGTGGDGKNTFNISTLACFIVAGAGQKVAKHGNYGATSVSGASNVMQGLGYRFKTDSSGLNKELEEAGICFLHAPLFHSALKNVAAVRKALGIRTFFNMLGPLVNPAQPAYQLVGVYSPEMARIYNYMLQQTGKRFTIVHGLDGYDEISLTNDTKIITEEGERLATPEELGKRMVQQQDIYGGHSAEEAVKLFSRIIRGEGSWSQNAVVLANAAVALQCTGHYPDYEEAYNAAVESLESGSAAACLQKLISLQ
jgi:anthranilate phosphoribosyltransferase